MPDTIQRSLPLMLVLILVVIAILMQRQSRPPAPAPPPSPALSVLGEMPDWKRLEVFHETITRTDFERLLTTIFTTSEAWRGFIVIDDAGARIATGVAAPDDMFHLRFAADAAAMPTPRDWKTTAGLPPAPPDKPLAGLHIAIDPGHIGGAWAKTEERWLQVRRRSAGLRGRHDTHRREVAQAET